MHCRCFKKLLLTLLTACVVFFIWFTLSLPSTLYASAENPPLSSSLVTVLLSITAAGLFLGAGCPLYMELAVELTFPLPEAVSAGLITLFNNIGAVLFLVVPPSASKSMNAIMTATVIFTALLVGSVTEVYKRSKG
jgi:hypothetical protein